MGLKINGSLNGLQSTVMTGAGLFVSQRAIQRPTHDALKRHFAFPVVSAIPHGYSVNGIVSPITGGGIATRMMGDSVEVFGLTAVARMGTAFTGSAAMTALASAGRGMGFVVTGSVGVVFDPSAIANMSCNFLVNSAPKPIDIAGEIMATILPNGQTVETALNLNLDIKNTATAVLGLSV